MRLAGSRVAFGRHETFPLRFSWLPKGYQALEKNPKVFESDDATVHLGVGRNMVNAIRYWLRASRMVAVDSYQSTELGKLILSKEGYDPYLEDEATIWLLHWLVASNSELATSLFWFFNKFQKREFSTNELSTALTDFLEDVVPKNKRPAKNTIKSDSAVILRMYTQSKITQRMPLEEALDSPYALLKLVEHKASERLFLSRLQERASLPIEILGFAVLEVMRFRQQGIVPIEDLMYCKEGFAAPGSIFRLSENSLVKMLEDLTLLMPDVFDIRESSGVHQLFLLTDPDPLSLIESYYGRTKRERAA